GTFFVGSSIKFLLNSWVLVHKFCHSRETKKSSILVVSIQKGFLDFSRFSGAIRSDHIGKSSGCSLYFVQSFLTESFLRRTGGAMLESTGSHSVGVDFKVPVMTRITVFNWASILLVCELFIQTGLQYSAFEKTNARAVTRSVLALAPQVEPTNFNKMLFLVFSFCLTFSR